MAKKGVKMSVAIKRYRMGSYIISTSRVKPLKNEIRRVKRHNRTYRGTLTKRNKEINGNRAIALLLAWCIFATTYAFAMTSNNIQFNGEKVFAEDKKLSDEADALSTVELSLAEDLNLHSSSAEAVMTPEEQIRRIAKEQSFKWTDYLIRLAKCESTLNPRAINVNSNGSRDLGIFQINDIHGLSDEFRYNIEKSTLWTIDKINSGQQRIWVCNNLI